MPGPRSILRSYSPVFWLVIVFEFFERGSYYGVMSVLSVYLTDVLGFAKEDVGVIKSTIQPLLYFLPIITGALADRFGFRRALLVAFTLLGTGYFLTAQMTSYAHVFLALCVMGLGAGAFKPIISGTIARVTDQSTSTMGFGIYYWTINLGAFLFPLILVPYLKNNIGWEWVLVAAAVGTGTMVLPTLFLYREPERAPAASSAPQLNLLQTLANAFEIVYAPIVLVFRRCQRSAVARAMTSALAVAFAIVACWHYAAPRQATVAAPGVALAVAGSFLEVRVDRNMMAAKAYDVSVPDGTGPSAVVEVHRPDSVRELAGEMVEALRSAGFQGEVAESTLVETVQRAVRPQQLRVVEVTGDSAWELRTGPDGAVEIMVGDPGAYATYRDQLLMATRAMVGLETLSDAVVDSLMERAARRPFLLLYVAIILAAAVAILAAQPAFRAASAGGRSGYVLVAVVTLGGLLWLLPDLSLFARILCTVIACSVLSLFLIDVTEERRFRDHFRFLLLIFLYSGFWVMYFQMMDSVLWYVQDYVDPSALNRVVNQVLGAVGLQLDWRFDVEHVTVVNAGTIILLQLLVSAIVAKTKALPTMIVGIALGTIGMAILAVSISIWVFLAGIIIFSVGEMTAHPKLISYVGQIAPRDRVATYMGYIFLYGVIGSSIAGVLGAKLYVHYVDNLNQPRTLWIIFSLIGVATVISLALYNRLAGGVRDEV